MAQLQTVMQLKGHLEAREAYTANTYTSSTDSERLKTAKTETY